VLLGFLLVDLQTFPRTPEVWYVLVEVSKPRIDRIRTI
jgi:hypothetical protein